MRHARLCGGHLAAEGGHVHGRRTVAVVGRGDDVVLVDRLGPHGVAANEGALHHLALHLLSFLADSVGHAGIADIADIAQVRSVTKGAKGADVAGPADLAASSDADDEVVEVLAADRGVAGAHDAARDAVPVERVVRRALQQKGDAVPGEDDGGGHDEVLQQQLRAGEGGELP